MRSEGQISHLSCLLKEGREIAGISQEKLARKLGYDTGQFISSMERGICSLPAAQISDLAKILGIKENAIIKALVMDYADRLKKEILK